MLLAFGGEGKQALRVGLGSIEKSLPVGVPLYAGVFVVVKTSAAHLLVLHVKAQGFYQVQGAARVGRKANDVAGIGRYFRLVEDDVKHGAAQCSACAVLMGAYGCV